MIKEEVWIKKFTNEFEYEVTETITLYGNNEINITLTKNIESQHCTKHINVQRHYI